ncbi:unnamed protein product [Somion occarium]|uniref:Uncharacterized protein n=1 Tax=Somion occarium TaxID=3059160 RepID=A0ABP1DUM5_9APHY
MFSCYQWECKSSLHHKRAKGPGSAHSFFSSSPSSPSLPALPVIKAHTMAPSIWKNYTGNYYFVYNCTTYVGRYGGYVESQTAGPRVKLVFADNTIAWLPTTSVTRTDAAVSATGPN